MEAVKVRVQTQPGFARGLGDGLPKLVKSEGALGLYKGLVPLWGRQIPCKLRHLRCNIFLLMSLCIFYSFCFSFKYYLCSKIIVGIKYYFFAEVISQLKK
ncbi:putative mitochondrial carrier domain superfamily [Helianthus anomalus]